MSSQSVNSTSYSGYTTASTGGNATNNDTNLGQIPMRDGSDYTRQIREQIIYQENKGNSPAQPGNAENKWMTYGNQFRLNYFFGKLKCPTACPNNTPHIGNAFNGNGAYSNVSGGLFGGS